MSSTLKIAVDARIVGTGAGVDYYTRDLLVSLAKIGKSGQITLLISSEAQKGTLPGYSDFLLLPPKKAILDHFRFKGLIAKHNFSAVLHPDNTAYLSDLDDSYIILHDILPWVKPETILSRNPITNRVQKFYLTLQRRALRKAKKIITVSNHSQTDIHRVLGVPLEKIEVVYESVSDIFSWRSPDFPKLAHELGISGDYCLYIGGFETNKNISKLLKAYDVSDYKGSLVLAGDTKQFRNSQIYQDIVAKMTKKDKLILGRTVSDSELASLYQNADFFIYPAYYGGFGRPILEALKSGCPVICSKSSSYPEIGGDAAIYFDPEDLNSMSSKINNISSLLKNDKEKIKLIKQGQTQARRFSWQKSATQIWDILSE